MIMRYRPIRFLPILFLLSSCATAPVYPPEWANSQALPSQVSAAPENHVGARVIWGGQIIRVDNLADHTEVQILAFPLDKSQIPVRNDIGGGRFIALLPGYVEPMSYPVNGWVTMQGRIRGVHSGHIGEAAYVFPLLDVQAAHVWSREAMQNRPNVNFSIGVGVGIH